MLDKKEVSKAIDNIIYYYGIMPGNKSNTMLNNVLQTICGLSRSIDNGHFDVKELTDD